jgi:hypothetical protein
MTFTPEICCGVIAQFQALASELRGNYAGVIIA